MEDTTDADYPHTNWVRRISWFVCSKRYFIVNWCIWEPQKYVSWDYELDLARFLSAPGFVWQEPLKKTKVKLDFLTDTDMLLTVEKGIGGGIGHSIYQYPTANNKYIKDSD